MADRRTMLRRAVRTAVHNNASAYGYSIMVTATFGVLQVNAGPPSVARAFLYLGGAALAFAVVEGLTSNLFRQSAREEPPEVVVLGGAMGVASVSGGVGAATLVSLFARSWIGWAAAPFAATVVYVSVVSAELMLADHLGNREQ